jgi:integrase
MKARLTELSVARLKPPKVGRLEVWDLTLPAFGLRLTAAGGRSWIVALRKSGAKHPVRHKMGEPPVMTLGQARDRARQLLADPSALAEPEDKGAKVERERAEARERAERLLRSVGKRWVDQMRREGKRSADEVERTLERHVCPELGARSIESITRADAHKVFDGLANAGHVPMGHLVIRNLKTLMSFAVERGMREFNPLLRIKLGDKPRPRKRILIRFHPEREPDPSELLAIWRAAERIAEPHRTFVKVLILSMQRRDEVGRMRWNEFDGGLWLIPEERHKGRRGHAVPLPRQALELIDVMPKERRVRGRMVPVEYVFAGKGGRPIGDFSALKSELDRLSGVKEWQLQRDMRRTAATWLEDAGGFTKDDVHAVLGHSLGDRLAETYMTGPGYFRKKSALQAWADYVTRVVEGSDAKIVALRAGAM